MIKSDLQTHKKTIDRPLQEPQDHSGHSILLLNGPNINLLGRREPGLYGTDSLATIEQRLQRTAAHYQCRLNVFQSNHEGLLIDRIHQSLDENTCCLIFNPGAYTHTSIALRDAILSTQIPFIEVHISQVFQREPFRHTSFFADIAQARLVGFGTLGYDYALAVALNLAKGI